MLVTSSCDWPGPSLHQVEFQSLIRPDSIAASALTICFIALSERRTGIYFA
jgi:hypothetical protein